MNVLLIWILLVVQLVALSLGAQLPANQPDGDKQHEVSAQAEQERIADDAVVAPSDGSVDSMETDATYHRRYYYPTHHNTRRYYNTNYQNNRRPYYNNRYPQSNNYVNRPTAYRPPTYYPGTGYLNNVLSTLISHAAASGATIEHNVAGYDSFLGQAQAAGVPLVYNPNLETPPHIHND